MSEDFDKEAEREKLREKYEDDQKRRETTQQMSELLLKGATMTNRHCDTCGDPVFRHDGQEFCANCQTVGGETGGEAAEGSAAAAGQGRPATGDETPGEDAPGRRDDAAEARDDGVSEVPVEPESRQGPGGPDRTSEPESGSESKPERRATAPSTRRDPSAETASPPADAAPSADAAAPSAAADSRDAPAALQRALEKFSRLAADTDDPREAREHLAAAREAAEALAAVRSASR